jgi:TonB family protein
MNRTATIALGLVVMVLVGAAGAEERASDSVAVARDLYSSAQYEDALGMLDRLKGSQAPLDEMKTIEQYRAYCLFALGRATDAEQAIAAVVMVDPLFVPADAAMSPRLRSTFRDVRRRTLPAVVQQQYAVAKDAFDRKDFAQAAAGFNGVLQTLADADLAALAGAPPLSDLRTLASGFRDLSVTASAPPPPPPPPPAVVAQPPAPKVPSIFTSEDPEVSPPVAVKQGLPAFPAGLIGTPQGVLEVVVNEDGQVESAAIRVSINPRYDRLVLDAARMWRYQPAMRDGKPVKYRKMIQVAVKR